MRVLNGRYDSAAGLSPSPQAPSVPALVLGAAELPSALTQAQPGLWEISGAPGAKAPVRQCIGDLAALARFEHRAGNCTAKVLSAIAERRQ